MRHLSFAIIALAILATLSAACTRKDTVIIQTNGEVGKTITLCIIGQVTLVQGIEGSITDSDTVQVQVTDSTIRIEGELQGIILPSGGDRLSQAHIEAIDLTSCPNLAYFGCDGAAISAIDLTQNPKIEFLHLQNMRIANPRLYANPMLIDLRIRNCALDSINLANNPNLKYLLLDGNHLAHLNLAACPALELLSCSGSSLQQLNLTHTPMLKWLWCDRNDLTELDLSANPQLELLDCSRNRLRTLNLTQATNLVEIAIHTNIMQQEGMATLVNSLPHTAAESRKIIPLWPGAIDDMNELNEALRATISSKGWRIAHPNEATSVNSLFEQ